MHSGVLSLDSSITIRFLFLVCSLFTLGAICGKSFAAEDNSQLCPASFLANQPQPIVGDTQDKRVYISSDSAKVDSEAVTLFEGNVKAKQGNKILEADSVSGVTPAPHAQ